MKINLYVSIKIASICMSNLIVLGCLPWFINHENNLALAEEYAGCFMTDHNGRVLNLEGLCSGNQEKKSNQEQIVKGIKMANLSLLDEKSGYPLVIGKITNTTDQNIQVKTIIIQIEDNQTNDVVTTETLDVAAILAPGQSREFRERLNKEANLGGRSYSDLQQTFIDWE